MAEQVLDERDVARGLGYCAIPRHASDEDEDDAEDSEGTKTTAKKRSRKKSAKEKGPPLAKGGSLEVVESSDPAHFVDKRPRTAGKRDHEVVDMGSVDGFSLMLLDVNDEDVLRAKRVSAEMSVAIKSFVRCGNLLIDVLLGAAAERLSQDAVCVWPLLHNAFWIVCLQENLLMKGELLAAGRKIMVKISREAPRFPSGLCLQASATAPPPSMLEARMRPSSCSRVCEIALPHHLLLLSVLTTS